MNQIIFCDLSYFYKAKKYYIKKISIFFIVFAITILLSISIIIYSICNKYKIYKKHLSSSKLLYQYNINTLYSVQNSNTLELSNDINIIGLVEIPKLNISYPILSESNDTLLKISVCRFSRPITKSKRKFMFSRT